MSANLSLGVLKSLFFRKQNTCSDGPGCSNGNKIRVAMGPVVRTETKYV